MANFTKTNVSYKAAKVYVTKFEPESAVALAIPNRTTTLYNDNVDNVIAYLEANYVFNRMAGFKNVKISDIFENEVSDEVDDCDIQERQKKAEISTTFTGDRLTTLDLGILEILLGFGYSSKTGAIVNNDTYTLSANSRSQDKFYRLPYQHHDASGNIIKPDTYSVTAGGAGIVDGTGYRIEENAYGEFGIVLYSTVDTTNEVIVTYDHLTITADFAGFEFGDVVQPYFIVKIETCPDENGKVHYYYITKSSLSGALDTNFISKGEVPLSSITLKWGLGGNKYFRKER